MTNTVNNREIALDILIQINEEEQYLHLLLSEALNKYRYLERNERAFISRLVRGTVERRITLDYVINSVSTVKINKMKPFIRNLLRMSVYQIMYMDQIPDSAACNEAVKLAQKRHFGNLKGFVNGVLRNVARSITSLQLPDDYAVKYSIPNEVISIIRNAYGDSAFEKIAESFLHEGRISVIANTTICTLDELKAQLDGEGVTYVDAPYVPNALILKNLDYPEAMSSFNEGMFQIQDISSMIAGMVTAPAKNSTVIDVCAAPGGKSIYAAMMMEGTGKVISRDVSDRKVAKILENINRLCIKNVDVQLLDATIFNEADCESADYVIADVPCSGLGIIGRKPDIKYNVSADKIEEIVKLQRQILDVAVRYVKPGGYIILSTCTLNPMENEENVSYLKAKGFETADISPDLPQQLFEDYKSFDEAYYKKVTKDAKEGFITLIPGVCECDGFFVAKLKKQVRNNE